MVNAQQWLNANYPKEKRHSITSLEIGGWDYIKNKANSHQLEGSLDLSDFTNLEYLDCQRNQITKLDLSGLSKLQVVACNNNLLTEFDFSALNPESLVELYISDNSLPEQDLSAFSEFTNLEILWIGNGSEKKIDEGNLFYGSLEPLQNLNKLKRLSISNTNIDSGLEYLPKDLQHIFCKNRGKFKCQEIIEKMRKYEKDDTLVGDWVKIHTSKYTGEIAAKFIGNFTGFMLGMVGNNKRREYYDYQEWRRDNQGLVGEVSNNVQEHSIESLTLNKQSDFTNEKAKLRTKPEIFPRDKIFSSLPVEGLSHCDNSGAFIFKESSKNEIEVETEWKSFPVFESKLNEDDDFWAEGGADYSQIYPTFFKRGFDDRKTAELPTKLIKIGSSKGLMETEVIKVEQALREDNNIENYAILSYSWGAPPWSKFRKNTKNPKDLMHGGSKKSFRKAVKACKEGVNINYLWVDALCIDQTNKNELVRELVEVRKYYSNAKVTLIAIQKSLRETQEDIFNHLQHGSENMESVFSSASDIIWIIVKSNWFKRSWTFQEGLLSRQTVFMFDDCLIDGRLLAMTWSIKQRPERTLSTLTKEGDLEDFLRSYSKKVATPLGWAYYHDGYNSNDTVYLNLFHALEAIKERKRYIAVDGIYSVIGLLPYRVRPDYKVELWGDTKYNYSNEEEVTKVLVEVMKVAVQEGHGELFSWYGESSNLLGFCWLPKILVGGENTDKNGSMIIEGVVDNVMCWPNSVEFTNDNRIKISGSVYKIISVKNVTGSGNDKFSSRELLVKVGSNSKWVNLQGTYKTLEKIKIENKGMSDIMLLVPDREQWKSDLSVALLVEKPGDKFYHRVDLVRILEGSENLTNEKKDLIIGINDLSGGLGQKQQCLSEMYSYMEVLQKK